MTADRNQYPPGWNHERVESLIRYYDRRMPAVKDRLPLPFDLMQLTELCLHHNILRLSAFGSVLRDDFRSGSDLDLLVEFLPGQTPGFAFFEIQDQLSQLFGRKVDLKTPEDLPKSIREEVRKTSLAIYNKDTSG